MHILCASDDVDDQVADERPSPRLPPPAPPRCTRDATDPGAPYPQKDGCDRYDSPGLDPVRPSWFDMLLHALDRVAKIEAFWRSRRFRPSRSTLNGLYLLPRIFERSSPGPTATNGQPVERPSTFLATYADVLSFRPALSRFLATGWLLAWPPRPS
ncbi:hypothetical protein T492DRAFT_2081 [Pavlovales sp. CCMP2436]|nr:hypothetical protein T492DRAFT_2081 [Pavlovales sp. CCMP2436]